jgi:hypothetical protein
MIGTVFDEALSLSRRMKPGQMLRIDVYSDAVRIEMEGGDERPQRYTQGEPPPLARQLTWPAPRTDANGEIERGPGRVRPPRAAVVEAPPDVDCADPNNPDCDCDGCIRSQEAEAAERITAPIAEAPRTPASASESKLEPAPDLETLYRPMFVFTIAAKDAVAGIHDDGKGGIIAWETPNQPDGVRLDRLPSTPVFEHEAEFVRVNLRKLAIPFDETTARALYGDPSQVFFTTPKRWEALGDKARAKLHAIGERGFDPGWGYGNWPDEVDGHRYIATKPMDPDVADDVSDLAKELGLEFWSYCAPVWTCLACNKSTMHLDVGGRCLTCDRARYDAKPKAGAKPKAAKKTRARKKKGAEEECTTDESRGDAASASTLATASSESVTSSSPDAPASTNEPSPESNSDVSAPPAVEASASSPPSTPPADDDEFAVPATRTAAPTLPSWLEESKSTATEELAPTASIAIDGTGLHGTLFDDCEPRVRDALAAIRSRLNQEQGVAITGCSYEGGPSTDFRAAFNTVMVTEAKRRGLLANIEGLLGARGYEVASSVDWLARGEASKTEAIAASPAPAPSKLAPSPPPAPPPASAPTTLPKLIATPSPGTSSSGKVVIEIAPTEWKKLDANGRSKVRRTLRKYLIEFEDNEESLTSKPFDRSNAGLMTVMDTLRELSIAAQPKAAA